MGLVLGYRRLRWFIVAWITLSTILNLIDRQTLSILAPVLREQFRLSHQDYSNIVSAFLVSYTVMYTVGGWFVDRAGERLGMAACISWWSVATMMTALAQGAWSLGFFRFLLGIGEPGNYPAALRACTTWFPKAERGLPIAIFSSGSSVGSVIAAPLVAWLTLSFGWRSAFVIPGSLGLLWVIVWLATYRLPEQYPGISREELACLHVTGSASPAGPGNPARQPWAHLLKDRNVLALVLARFVSDPVWYFYLFWIPDYLKSQRGFSLKDIGMYAWIPFVAGALGGVSCGWISDRLIRAGFQPAAARRRVLYVSAACAPLGMLTGVAPSAAWAIALIAAMAFIVYSWFINTAALISDVFPEQVVGSVLGLMGTAGSGAGILFAQLVGFLLSHYSYTIVFVLAGSMHLLASFVLWSLMREQQA